MNREETTLGDAMLGMGSNVQSRKGGSGSSKDAGGGQYDELFKLNQVLYRLPNSLSLVSKRTVLKQQFQNISYPGAFYTTLQAIFNTGEFYVNMRNSVLVIRVGYTTPLVTDTQPVRAYLSGGNVTSLFEETTFTSASGTEVCREQNKGLLNTHLQRNTLSYPYIQDNGQLQGFTPMQTAPTYSERGYTPQNGVTSVNGVDYLFPGPELCAAGPQTFIVPMSQVLGCWNPYMSVLTPSGMLAGGSFLMRMKNPVEALIFSGPGTITLAGNAGVIGAPLDYTTNYSVTDIYFLLDAFQLNDSVLKRLNEVSSGSNGMAYMFNTYDNSVVTNAGLGTVEVQVQQTKSRIGRSWVVPRDSKDISNPYSNSMCAEAIFQNPGLGLVTSDHQYNRLSAAASLDSQRSILSYQAQLGSLFFPQQPLGRYAEEFWFNQLYVFVKGMSDEKEYNTISYPDFIGGIGQARYIAGVQAPPSTITRTGTNIWWLNFGWAIFGMLAERSTILQLSGLPLSNARLLRHIFNFALPPASGSTRTLDCFTEYVKVAKIYLGGRMVIRE